MNYIVHGNDESRMQIKVDNLKKKHHIDLPILYLDACQDDMSVLLSELDSSSLFGDTKMIVLKNSTFLCAKNTTKYDLNELLKRTDHDQIIVYWCESEKLDTRKKNVKAMIAQSQVISCIRLDARSQASYIQELCREYKVSLDPDAMKWFSLRVGMDSLKIEKEIEKLSIYNPRIRLEDVQALVCVEPADDIFKMVNALFERNGLRFLSYYRNFRSQNMETVAIVALIASQIRFLYQVSVLMRENYSKEEIASTLKAHPYRVQVNMQTAAKFSCDELLDHLNALALLDQNLKMGKVDKDVGFEQFALRLMTA